MHPGVHHDLMLIDGSRTSAFVTSTRLEKERKNSWQTANAMDGTMSDLIRSMWKTG